jgi:hypothetical protein
MSTVVGRKKTVGWGRLHRSTQGPRLIELMDQSHPRPKKAVEKVLP